MTPLQTDRLILRPFVAEDAPFLLRLLNEPSFIENITDKGVRTLDQARSYLTEGLLAIVSPGNAAAIRLLEALAFRCTGTLSLSPGDEVAVCRAELG